MLVLQSELRKRVNIFVIVKYQHIRYRKSMRNTNIIYKKNFIILNIKNI